MRIVFLQVEISIETKTDREKIFTDFSGGCMTPLNNPWASHCTLIWNARYCPTDTTKANPYKSWGSGYPVDPPV